MVWSICDGVADGERRGLACVEFGDAAGGFDVGWPARGDIRW